MRPLSPARLLGAAAVLALLAPASPAAADDPKIPNQRYLLDNGLEVILHQDNTVPLVAVDVWYHVGSGVEQPGKSGFAHLFEHMLFQSSTHVGEDKFFKIIRAAGGSDMNGSTTQDRTNYFEVVPSNQLETALWIESDRMAYFLPTLTQDSLDNQKEVVRNEKRENYDNVPYGKTRERRFQLLFPPGHPYKNLVIGKHEDVANASLEDVRRFYQTWYVPANATLVIAGDFDSKQCKDLVAKWFASFPKTSRPAQRKLPLPVLPHSVRETLKDRFAKLRQVSWAWHAPAAFADGNAEMHILAQALASDTGRLYRRLVVETKLATAVAAYNEELQLSSVFTVVVTLRSDADQGKVEQILDDELGKVMAAPITQREFDRVVVNREAGFVWGLQRLLSRAETLQRYNHYVGTPDFISADLDRWRKSSPDKVRAAAARYLGRDHRVELTTIPEAR
ncbi:MAG TPA: pitrilysin family protein [Kofleriaceae bacterium]|jgi:predicted Zn-dependent peptidase|nr:pitrilysin family protein [Kofleriaceae bacterium]